MKTAPSKISAAELAALRLRLVDAEETLRAIRHDAVDALMGDGKQGKQVYSLAGAEHAYRMRIEAMNEGAPTLTKEKTILYANRCFASMVKCPLEQVTGGSFRRFLPAADRATLHLHFKQAERGLVALELHDNITQLLCAILVRSQTLADQLSTHSGPAQQEALKLRDLLGHTAEEVECITRNLRHGLLELLGLDAVLRATSTEVTALTGVALTARLPGQTELALYRILQEALKNVHKHARARNVSVHLAHQATTVQLVIKDDGVGFNSERQPAQRKGSSRLGLLGMRERAAYVGGSLTVKSERRNGTEIEVKILLSTDNTTVY